MEPGYYRGDILFLTNYDKIPELGDIVVYQMRKDDIPIVHRVIAVQKKGADDFAVLTKGDNNEVDDRAIYRDKLWLTKKEIVGRVRASIPYLGMATIILTENQYVKFTVLGIAIVLILVTRGKEES
eukprot:TRINITY_DN10166_c0_g1_i5.p1 TRINITY_DN10166_c0_g1~~TRINITY_DN10166_c0_g1_i5.p1  ORF type:complete len:126 (+),score=39.03 TRINITY_DN10166_c0_g1_i5:257-634(+)